MTVNIVKETDEWVRIRNVLISVSDKQGLDRLVSGLISINDSLQIFSTGGTYKRIADIFGPEATQKHLKKVSDYTGQPETQGGLVKTLDFKIYLGLLTETYNTSHQDDLNRTEAVPIDMVVVNLYPFKQTIAQPDVTPEKARSNIDIGGPCMTRAAAKNFLRVAVLTDPTDYAQVIKNLRQNGGRLNLGTRFDLARKAFSHTSQYDTEIAKYLNECSEEEMKKCYLIKEGS